MNITIYSKDICPYCDRAKNFFKNKGLEYHEIKITDDKIKQEMIEKSNGRMTVPQIFINDHHIGGWDDLSALNSSGELKKILESA